MTTSIDQLLEESEAPQDEPVEELDVRNLGPPKPLSQTLETLAEMDDGVLLQRNDRASQHLYPKLEDRGYNYATFEREDETVTLIWR